LSGLQAAGHLPTLLAGTFGGERQQTGVINSKTASRRRVRRIGCQGTTQDSRTRLQIAGQIAAVGAAAPNLEMPDRWNKWRT
jgi:hypothetical protein